MRRYLLTAASALAVLMVTLVALALANLSGSASGSPQAHYGSAMMSRQWIVSTSPAISAVPPGNQQTVHQAPTAVAGGGSQSMSSNLSHLAETMAPAGATLVNMQDYPTLKAALVTFQLADGETLSVAAQKLTKAVSLSTITLGSAADVLTTWPSGTQVVVVRHAEPFTVQIVIARQSGMLLTVTLSSATGLSSPEASLSNLEAQVQSHLDASAADSL
jgi:hypothetical protein